LLIVVLWVMGLVSVAVGTLTMRSTHGLRVSRIPLESLQREAIAQAALHQARALIGRDDPAVDHLEEPWATGKDADQELFDHVAVASGMFQVGVLERAGEVTIGLIDENRKLNLNTTTEATLHQLIDAVLVSGADAQRIAQAIVDWRDEPQTDVCRERDPPCHNGLFDTVEELRLVPGMTPALFDALEPYVTVYGEGFVNVNTASALVLTVMGCPGEDLVHQRASGPFTAAPAECPMLGVTSRAFTVPIEAWLVDSSIRMSRRAVIDRSGNILAWNAP